MKDKEITYKDHVPRDVSWMFFNRRILQEAMKPRADALLFSFIISDIP